MVSLFNYCRKHFVDLVDSKVPRALFKRKRVTFLCLCDKETAVTPPSLKPRLFSIYLQKYKQMQESDAQEPFNNKNS